MSRSSGVAGSILAAPIQRPVATTMFFLAIVILGIFSWSRIPVELIPAFKGEQLFVSFYRPNSNPELLEREILQPLEAGVSQLPGVSDTSGEIKGDRGTLMVEFETGSNRRIRELELRNIAADLNRGQPPGSNIRVSAQDFSRLSQFVMSVHVTGNQVSDDLFNFVERQIQPQLESVQGVSQVIAYGNKAQEVSVLIDPVRTADLGITVDEVAKSLQRNIKHREYVGAAQLENRRLAVILDGQTGELEALKEIRIRPDSPVLLRHVADIRLAESPQDSISRVNGKDSVSLTIFQDQGANLIELGRAVRTRLEELQVQTRRYNVDLLINVDAAALIDEKLETLKRLSIVGFLIALVILYLYLRTIRAIAVVAVAIPVSLLASGAMLYLTGFSVNIITLFGLVIGVGMLVDNSIVVQEAVQRRLDSGSSTTEAAHLGVGDIARAIIAASATNAIIFLPLLYVTEVPFSVRMLVSNIVPAILFPLFSSLVVAIFLVPMLAQKFGRISQERTPDQSRRASIADPTREVTSGLLKLALRNPLPWLTSVLFTVLATIVVAVPWVFVSSINQQSSERSTLTLEVNIEGGSSLDYASHVFERLEQAALAQSGIRSVESTFREEQGTLTVQLNEDLDSEGGARPATIRRAILNSVSGLNDVDVQETTNSASNTTTSVDSGAAQIAISGNSMIELNRVAERVRQRLESVPWVESTSVNSVRGAHELNVKPNVLRLDAFGIGVEEALRPLAFVGREGQTLQVRHTLASGQEIPIVLRQKTPPGVRVSSLVGDLPSEDSRGALTLKDITDSRSSQAPLVISHFNGRRELRVDFTLAEGTPASGPTRQALEKQLDNIVQTQLRPSGYSVESRNEDQSLHWAKLIVWFIVLLIYAVLAITFESITLPLLVLLAVPLMLLGAIWALFVTGLGLNFMAIIGIAVLLGLTVNPAILLVDRMQQRVQITGCSGGAAALAAVRQRVRPILMTSTTSIAGLLPLAVAHNGDLDLWPSFAVVVIGGLVAATILTLFFVPIGYVFLAALDRKLAGFSTWLSMLVVVITALILALLVQSGIMPDFSTQFLAACVVSGILIALIRWFLKHTSKTPSAPLATFSLETRYLSKHYSQEGPVRRAWKKYQDSVTTYAHKVPAWLRHRLVSSFVLSCGALYLTLFFRSTGPKVVMAFVTGYLVWNIVQYARLLVLATSSSVDSNTQTAAHNALLRRALLVPWLVLIVIGVAYTVWPLTRGEGATVTPTSLILIGLVIGFIQLGRRVARSVIDKEASFHGFRIWLRSMCRKLFYLGAFPDPFVALSNVHVTVNSGMIGILGPNGAGKTTFLRMLASILKPSIGTLHYAQENRSSLRHRLFELIGYLPQEFGLPEHLSGREYLDYFALLYRLGNQQVRAERVEEMLKEVGLVERQHDRIGQYSGGMKQRLAIARALLHRAKLIIVDEPTVGLDPRERIRFRNLLSRLARDRVVLFSTHIIEDIAISCDRVMVINKGRLVFDGKPDELTQIAEHCVWTLQTSFEQLEALKREFNVVEHALNDDGSATIQVISPTKPHPDAQAKAAGMEDGYMQVLAERAEDESYKVTSWHQLPETQTVSPEAPKREYNQKTSLFDSWRDGVRKIRLAYQWDFGKRVWLMALASLAWPLFQAARGWLGWKESSFGLVDVQNSLLGLPLYVLAIVYGTKLVAGEIHRRTLEVTYLLPGGSKQLLYSKTLAALSTIALTTLVLALFIYLVITPVGLLPLFKSLGGAAFYFVLAAAAGVLFRSELIAVSVCLAALFWNLSATDSKWTPLFNTLSVENGTKDLLLQHSIHSLLATFFAGAILVSYILVASENRERLLRD